MKIKISRLLLLFFVVYFLNSCSSDSPTSESVSTPPPVTIYHYAYNSFEDETLILVNSHRVSIGLNALEKNNYISIQSEEHDEYMIANNTVSHDNFSSRYNSIVETLGAIRVGENIAYNYNTPKAVMDAWLKSPSHKECIEGDYSHFGISIRVSSQGKIYCTNIFAKIDKNKAL
ncbi:MAG: CAP domain-containing protein [Bacteroidota bacterium]